MGVSPKGLGIDLLNRAVQVLPSATLREQVLPLLPNMGL